MRGTLRWTTATRAAAATATLALCWEFGTRGLPAGLLLTAGLGLAMTAEWTEPNGPSEPSEANPATKSPAPPAASGPGEPEGPRVVVGQTADFSVNGTGGHVAWQHVDWTNLNRRPGGTHDYRSRFKLLYSDTGFYVLMDGTDTRLTATLQHDFEDLWNEDVFEFFLWTDERHPVYFEYEISPLNKELPILIPNFGGQFLGWRPWHYDGKRRIQKGVAIIDGEPISGTMIGGWRAEVYLPYDLLQPLQNVPPKPGTRWRANFYRVDYDDGRTTSWDWARVGESFHEYTKFGVLEFK